MYRSFFLLTFLFAACKNERTDTLFTSLPTNETGLDFSNDLREDDRFNIIKYLYYYNGGGVAIGDVNNDELPDIFLTANELPNKLFLNRGGMKFEDVTGSALPLLQEGGGGRWSTGVTMADVNADGWLDIYVCEVGFYKSVRGRNRLFINQGLPPTPSKRGGDVLFKEEAEKYGLAFRGFSQQAAFFDYDLDGDLDCFLLNHSTHSSESFSPAANRTERDKLSGDRLYRNDGSPPQSPQKGGGFTDVSESAGIFGGTMGYGLGVVVSDLNADGWPDIYVTNDFHENDYLYLNSPQSAVGSSQSRTFKEVIASATGHTSTFSMGVDAADVNNDGLVDVMTLDMRPDSITVERASAGTDHYNLQQMKLGNGYHAQFPVNSLQSAVRLPAGGVQFQNIAELAGVASTDWSWSTLLADFDGDGWKDIFVTNGIWRRPNDLDYLRFASDAEVKRRASDQDLAAKMPSGKVANYAFRNAPSISPKEAPPAPQMGGVPTHQPSPLGGIGGGWGSFEDVSTAWGLDLIGCSNGAAYADLDNDGDLDLVVNNLNAPASIFQNNSNQNKAHNFLKIKLVGNQKNLFGIGAKVMVNAGGMEQTQELSPTRGWQSSSDHVLVFGLGQNEKVDEVKVVWPGEWMQVLTDVPANQTLVLDAVNAVEKADSFAKGAPAGNRPFSEIPSTVRRPPSTVENRFTDFNVEPLLPWMLSTQGPKMDWGDLPNGRTGMYLGGAKGQPGRFFVFGDSLNFVATEQPDFEKDFLCEDVSATLFDADGDLDLDLYVVSGGGEYREGSAQLRDRFYENKPPQPLQKGGSSTSNFVKKENALPDFAVNGSVVIPFDFDGDMDLDLFVGSRSVPGSFGLSPKSFLLKNDPVEVGQIRFVDVTEEVCPALLDLGMVTSAVWLWREEKLVIAGEWMGLEVFDFSTFPEVASPVTNHQSPISTHGLWQTLEAADFDGDGDLDILAGNFGLNTRLAASPDEPLELYVKDFDGNGATDPIVTWYQDGKQYPLVTKDALVQQLPNLKKKYVGYRDFAEATFEDIFDEKMQEGAVHKKVTELRSMYFENLGDGKFEGTPLPLAAQVAPIFSFLVDDFDDDGNLDALAVGNFHGLRPDLGKADASYGHFLKGVGQGNFTVLSPAESGFFVPGEARDLAYIPGADGKGFVVVGRNGGEVLVFLKK